MTDSVRSLWVHSMHECASVHGAANALAGIDIDDADPCHVELTKARRTRDFVDRQKLLGWFAAHNPLDVSDSRLRSVGTGVVAGDDDKITCDTAEDVGHRIMVSMDDKSFADVVMKKANQARTLSELTKKVKIGSSEIVVDANIMFARLLIIMAHSGDAESCFQHELTSIPTALFRESGLRKTDKSALAKELNKQVDTAIPVPPCNMHVLDGGCLLHRVVWPKSATYLDVMNAYLGYIRRHYSSCVVVFNGYGSGPSIKDSEHTQRNTLLTPAVSIEQHMPAYRSQSAFLMNTRNKQGFVELLVQHLQDNAIAAFQAKDDADTVIVRTALDIASKVEPVTVVADDTDILVLLVHHFKPDMGDMYMLSEITRLRSARMSIVAIREVRESIGTTASQQLLAVHALSVCDSTSALYGHGKGSVFRNLVHDASTLPLTDTLTSEHASQAEVVQAGLKLLLLLYSGKPDETLNHLRFRDYINMIATGKSRLRPERLPPTERAAHFQFFAYTCRLCSGTH